MNFSRVLLLLVFGGKIIPLQFIANKSNEIDDENISVNISAECNTFSGHLIIEAVVSFKGASVDIFLERRDNFGRDNFKTLEFREADCSVMNVCQTVSTLEENKLTFYFELISTEKMILRVEAKTAKSRNVSNEIDVSKMSGVSSQYDAVNITSIFDNSIDNKCIRRLMNDSAILIRGVLLLTHMIAEIFLEAKSEFTDYKTIGYVNVNCSIKSACEETPLCMKKNFSFHLNESAVENITVRSHVILYNFCTAKTSSIFSNEIFIPELSADADCLDNASKEVDKLISTTLQNVLKDNITADSLQIDDQDKLISTSLQNVLKDNKTEDSLQIDEQDNSVLTIIYSAVIIFMVSALLGICCLIVILCKTIMVVLKELSYGCGLNLTEPFYLLKKFGINSCNKNQIDESQQAAKESLFTEGEKYIYFPINIDKDDGSQLKSKESLLAEGGKNSCVTVNIDKKGESRLECKESSLSEEGNSCVTINIDKKDDSQLEGKESSLAEGTNSYVTINIDKEEDSQLEGKESLLAEGTNSYVTINIDKEEDSQLGSKESLLAGGKNYNFDKMFKNLQENKKVSTNYFRDIVEKNYGSDVSAPVEMGQLPILPVRWKSSESLENQTLSGGRLNSNLAQINYAGMSKATALLSEALLDDNFRPYRESNFNGIKLESDIALSHENFNSAQNDYGGISEAAALLPVASADDNLRPYRNSVLIGLKLESDITISHENFNSAQNDYAGISEATVLRPEASVDDNFRPYRESNFNGLKLEFDIALSHENFNSAQNDYAEISEATALLHVASVDDNLRPYRNSVFIGLKLESDITLSHENFNSAQNDYTGISEATALLPVASVDDNLRPYRNSVFNGLKPESDIALSHEKSNPRLEDLPNEISLSMIRGNSYCKSVSKKENT